MMVIRLLITFFSVTALSLWTYQGLEIFYAISELFKKN